MLHPVASSEYPAGAGGPSPMTEVTSPPLDPIPSAVRIALDMLHPVASSESPAGAGGPSPMTEETSPPSDPIPSAVRIALEALGIKKIRKTTTGTFVGKPHEGHTLLGQGGFSKVYQGKEAASNGIILGDIALAKSIAKTIPTDFIPLLNSVPQSPFILARPILVPGNKHVRLRMDLLPPTGDLITQIDSQLTDWDKWTTLIQGMTSVAKALDVFHDCEMVHRDCTLDNSCTAGLFDHGTICKAGEFSPLMGANLEFLPQEILQAVSCLIDPSLEAAKLISDILTNRGNTHTELPSADFNLVERTIKHTCAVDIFILGAQFDRILKILYTPDVFIAHNLSFVTAMLHPDPLKRPTIKEIIPILEGYHLVLASKT